MSDTPEYDAWNAGGAYPTTNAVNAEGQSVPIGDVGYTDPSLDFSASALQTDATAAQLPSPSAISSAAAGAASLATLLAAGVTAFGQDLGMSENTAAGVAGALQDAGEGAAAGAEIGSLFPGIGTLIGAGVGALAGGILGFFTGESADAAKQKQQQIAEDKALISETTTLQQANAEMVNAKTQIGMYGTALQVLPTEEAGQEATAKQTGEANYASLLGNFGSVSAHAGQMGTEAVKGSSAGAAEVAPAIELGQFTGGSIASGDIDKFNVDEADRDFKSGVAQPVNGGTFAAGMASVQNQAYQNWTSYNNQVSMYQNSVIPTLQSTIATATSQINQLTAAGASVTGPVV
jgi:hypothetical protein